MVCGYLFLKSSVEFLFLRGLTGGKKRFGRICFCPMLTDDALYVLFKRVQPWTMRSSSPSCRKASKESVRGRGFALRDSQGLQCCFLPSQISKLAKPEIDNTAQEQTIATNSSGTHYWENKHEMFLKVEFQRENMKVSVLFIPDFVLLFLHWIFLLDKTLKIQNTSEFRSESLSISLLGW